MLINLHSHLEGRVRPSTALSLAAAAGLAEPPQGWEQAVQLDRPADLTLYLTKVAATYPFFNSWENVARIAREAVEDAAADGQDYLELRFGPATHVRPGFTLDDVIAAACEGVAEGTRTTGMPAGLVIAMLRHHDLALNESVARAAARFAGIGVAGLDLAGDEKRYPDLKPFATGFAIGRAAGLGLTCHAAEAAPGSAAREAVDLLGVSRIGHGAHMVEDPEILRWAAEQGVVVEICPTSNWYTGAIPAVHHHPAPAFRAAGVALVLGDDNPLQTRSPLSRERRILQETLGFDERALRNLDKDSIRAAFIEPSVRDHLTALFTLGTP
jgi:adenosine deaminase